MARFKWINKGDRNSKYFHSLITTHRRQNFILVQIKVENIMTFQHNHIMEEFIKLTTTSVILHS